MEIYRLAYGAALSWHGLVRGRGIDLVALPSPQGWKTLWLEGGCQQPAKLPA